MLVSQFIYTACGKDRSGAFSVFSKSRDITNEESAEIREVMIYKAPTGAEIPYEPTERQIEDLYPKKFGYFFLSSGRACLAQTCYVGRVYSDLDMRWGNYIIHAFVFKKTNDFAPYGFIEHPLFKRMLTRKEWHDDPIPDELPQIEIPENNDMLSMGEITSFFNEDRKNKLKVLIEAIINSTNENPVCFYDEHKYNIFWLKMLSLCLPRTTQSTVSFCTHFTNTLVPGNVSYRIQIRINQPESGLFNYAQEAQKGRYAFNFLRNIMPESISPGEYAKSIIISLSSGIFEAVKFVKNISEITASYDVNINEASVLIDINKEGDAIFKNPDEICNTIIIADRAGYQTQIIAKKLWNNMTKINFNARQKLGVWAFIYKNISEMNIKIEIIKNIIENAEQLELRADKADAFRDDLNSKANFIFANYLDYLKAERLADYAEQNKDSFPRLFLAFDFLANLPEVKNSFKTHKYNTSEEIKTVISIMKLTFDRQSVSGLDLLINSANSRVNGFGTELLFAVVQQVVIKTENPVANIKFAFEILQRLISNVNFAYVYLKHIIKANSDNDEFIKTYINAQNNDSAFYAKFENENKNDSFLAEFCNKKDMFCFINQPLSQKILKDYFDKYYITGKDKGVFVRRLGEYLCAIQPEKRINECDNMLKLMKFSEKADIALLSPVYSVILEVVFSSPYEKIYDLCGKQEWFEKINNIYEAVTNAGGGLKQETRELALVTLCGRILEKYGLKEDNQQVISFLTKTQTDTDKIASYINSINSDKSIDTFIEYYFHLAANILIIGAKDAKIFDYEGVLKKVFGKIIEKGNLEKISAHFINKLKKSKEKSAAFILFIFRKRLANSSNILDKKLGDIAEKYFEEISSGDRKKTFSNLLAFAEQAEAAQFERYFEEFNSKHKGGFLNLFKK